MQTKKNLSWGWGRGSTDILWNLAFQKQDETVNLQLGQRSKESLGMVYKQYLS